MVSRVSQQSPSPVKSKAPSGAAPAKAAPKPDAKPPPVNLNLPADYEPAKQKPVNMTGRYKAAGAQGPVDPKLAAEVESGRRLAQAGSAASKKNAGILHTDGRLSPKASWDQLPTRLKDKLPEKVWTQLPQKQRTTLLTAYSRLEGWGVWDQVKSVKGEKNPTEPHAHVGGAEFEVAGNTGGIVFEAKDAKAFEKALVATGHFGLDEGVVGALHPGQHSYREWTDDPGSLHVSVGPGNQFDAHVDKQSPVNQPKHGKTQIDPKRGPLHHSREVWPEMIRKVTGLPGVIIDATVNPGSRDSKPEVVATVNIELHGPVKSEKKLPHGPPPAGDAGPEGAVEGMLKQLDLSKVKFPRPKGVRPGDMPSPEVMAEELAHRMLEAAREGKGSISLDLVDYAHQKGYQTPMLGELRRLGEQVRRKLQAELDKLPPAQRQRYDLSQVKKLTVTFGVKGQGGTVSLTRD